MPAPKKNSSKKKKASKKKPQNDSTVPKRPLSWVQERLSMEPVRNGSGHSQAPSQAPSELYSFSIVSWNVLAESYLNRRTHHSLPTRYQARVFDKKQRRRLLQRSLKRLLLQKNTILGLQEVDLPEPLLLDLDSSLQFIKTPTQKGGGSSAGRVDACMVAYSNQYWTCLRQETVLLDDLATLGMPNTHDSPNNNMSLSQTLAFLRRNVALMVHLKPTQQQQQEIILVVVHLYWHPAFEYVKLCQAHHVMLKAREFANNGSIPIVVCGDFNSCPNSYVHTYLTRGIVNAKCVAPWYQTATASTSQESSDPNTANNDSPPQLQVRYLLDFTLNRFCRWLRILGIDAALETEQQERQRTKLGMVNVLFDRCRQERRTLVTTSTKLMLRKDCPPGAFLINPKTLLNLEQALVELLHTHGVVLRPRYFLSRCVVCNGTIETVHNLHDKQRIFRNHQAPFVQDDLEVYECNGCGQGYWWCDSPNSSASRVKQQATRLFETCLRGGIPYEGDLHMFDFVDVDGLYCSAKPRSTWTVLEWLSDSNLTCPLQLASAYAQPNGNDELLTFTNVTHDFSGVLDYVFYETKHFELMERLYVPTTPEELNTLQLANGHLLPSDVWPSDHLAVGATFILRSNKDGNVQDESDAKLPATEESGTHTASTTRSTSPSDTASNETTEQPTPSQPKEDVLSLSFARHGPRCACGCVPKVPSLFEMAAMRKAAQQALQEGS